jgi:hypothetical protein
MNHDLYCMANVDHQEKYDPSIPNKSTTFRE